MGDDTGADRAGQIAEFLVWTALLASSPVHVLLPLRDQGIDGIVPIPGTDIAAAIQVKSRHLLRRTTFPPPSSPGVSPLS
jgi:hypothetical protein